MKRTLALITLSLAVAANTYAQTFMSIGKSDGFEIFVPNGDANSRVGNAVLVRALEVNSDRGLAFAWQVLAACDGSWVSGPIQMTLKTSESISAREMYDYSKLKDETPPLRFVNFTPTNQTELYYVKAVARNAATLCKTAGKEPRNQLVPVSSSTQNDGSDASIAIVLGTSKREKNTVDLWVRSTNFKTVPRLDNNGKQIEIEGKLDTKREVTGAGKVDRILFNCKDRTMSAYERVEYLDKISEPKTTSIPRSERELRGVIPGSTGEVLLDTACSLYGTK